MTDGALEVRDQLAPIGDRTALSELEAAILGIDSERQSLEDAGDWRNLAIGLVQLASLHRQLAAAKDAVEQSLIVTMPDKRCEVEGLGIIERRAAKKNHKTDWDRLLPRLIRSAVDPDGTGELPSAPVLIEALRLMMASALPLTPSTQPRWTDVKERGIPADDFRSFEWGRQSVQITGSDG